MSNDKVENKRHPLPPNPFRRLRSDLTIAVNGSMVQGSKESEQTNSMKDSTSDKELGTFPGMVTTEEKEQIPENVPEPTGENRETTGRVLREGAHYHIENYREMVKTKQTASLKGRGGTRGGLPVGRGRGKYGTGKNKDPTTKSGRSLRGAFSALLKTAKENVENIGDYAPTDEDKYAREWRERLERRRAAEEEQVSKSQDKTKRPPKGTPKRNRIESSDEEEEPNNNKGKRNDKDEGRKETPTPPPEPQPGPSREGGGSRPEKNIKALAAKVAAEKRGNNEQKKKAGTTDLVYRWKGGSLGVIRHFQKTTKLLI